MNRFDFIVAVPGELTSHGKTKVLSEIGKTQLDQLVEHHLRRWTYHSVLYSDCEGVPETMQYVLTQLGGSHLPTELNPDLGIAWTQEQVYPGHAWPGDRIFRHRETRVMKAFDVMDMWLPGMAVHVAATKAIEAKAERMARQGETGHVLVCCRAAVAALIGKPHPRAYVPQPGEGVHLVVDELEGRARVTERALLDF